MKHHDGVLLINPGAITSGKYLSKQTLQSVAVLEVGDDVRVTHINLTDGKPFEPRVDWDAGFRAASNNTQASILPKWLVERWEQIDDVAQPAWPQFREAVLRAGNRVRSGECALLMPEMLWRELEKENLPAEVQSQLSQLLTIPSNDKK